MRTIKIYRTSQNSPAQSYQFEGATWGDLREMLGESSNTKATGRQTRATYDRDDSILSTQDSFFFVGPKQMKSGISDDTFDRIESLKEELLSNIEELFDLLIDINDETVQEAAQTAQSTACPECAELDEEARKLGL